MVFIAQIGDQDRRPHEGVVNDGTRRRSSHLCLLVAYQNTRLPAGSEFPMEETRSGVLAG